MRIGVDVGGTHTDAVLIEGETILASCKELTSADVISGVKAALANLAGQNGDLAGLEAVMLGTTQFTNAVVERRELAEVAAVRCRAGFSMMAIRYLPRTLRRCGSVSRLLRPRA